MEELMEFKWIDPSFHLLLLESSIEPFTLFNEGFNNDKRLGLYQILDKDDLDITSQSTPVTLVKPTKDHFRKVIVIDSFFFLNKDIRILMDTTIHSN